MNTSKYILFLFVLLLPFSLLANMEGEYITGDSPNFKPEDKLGISYNENEYQFLNKSKKNSLMILPLSAIRGAISKPEGVWVYWFDAGGITRNMLLDVKDGFADEMNEKVKEFNKKPMTAKQLEEYKERYQEYKQEAIEKAK